MNTGRKYFPARGPEYGVRWGRWQGVCGVVGRGARLERKTREWVPLLTFAFWMNGRFRGTSDTEAKPSERTEAQGREYRLGQAAEK